MRTRVGYAGGTKERPSYHALGDHTETVEIDYDPAVIRYEQLLAVFWDSHDAAAIPWSRQYMSIIFCHDEAQRRLASESRDRESRRRRTEIRTEIRIAGRFFRAEGYHQKHRLRAERDLLAEYTATYPVEREFVDSTAVARVNGFLDGYGTTADLERLLPALGLSPRGGERLTAIVGRRPGKSGCPL